MNKGLTNEISTAVSELMHLTSQAKNNEDINVPASTCIKGGIRNGIFQALDQSITIYTQRGPSKNETH